MKRTVVYLSTCGTDARGKPGSFFLQELPWLLDHFDRVVVCGYAGVADVTQPKPERITLARPALGVLRHVAAALCTVDSSAGLSLVVGLAGTASVLTVTGDGGTLSLTIGLDGTASMAFTGGGALSMIVPFEGTGSVAGVTGTADLRGILSMAGGWTPFTDLSPEGLARAVHAAFLAGPATPANVVQINSAGVAGTGQSGDMWRGE